MTDYRLTEQASEHIAAIMAWSEKDYGSERALRYESLILAAMADIAADPRRSGAARVARSAGIWVYDLSSSKNRLPRNQRILNPWHKILYRPLGDGIVEILAVVGLSYPSGRAAREATAAER